MDSHIIHWAIYMARTGRMDLLPTHLARKIIR
jgi:hypothetical protein